MGYITNIDAPVSAVESSTSSSGRSMSSHLNQSEVLSENDELSYPWESASTEELVFDNKMALIPSLHAPLSSMYETNNTMAIITSLDAPLSPAWLSTVSSENAKTSSPKPSRTFSDTQLSCPWSLASSEECESNNDMALMNSLDTPLSPAWPSTLSSEDFPPPSPRPKRTFPPRQIPYPWSLARSEEHNITKENDQFPFLKLPMELRHMIYELHLSKGGDFNAIPMFSHQRPVIGVNLIAICKQIYVEAVQHVYLGRTWNIGQQWIHPFLPLTTLTLFDDSFYYEAMNDRALARIEHLRMSIPIPSRNLLAHAEPLCMDQLKKMNGLRTLEITLILCGCSSLTQISGSTLGGRLMDQVFTVTDDNRIEISGTSMPTNLRKKLQTNVRWHHAHESALMAPHCTLFAPK